MKRMEWLVIGAHLVFLFAGLAYVGMVDLKAEIGKAIEHVQKHREVQK